MKLISSGAEGNIYEDNDTIIKNRIEKSYRIKQLDIKLRKTRTRQEAKILQKLPSEILHPELISMNDKNMQIVMSKIDGQKVRDILNTNINLCESIGQNIALMHNSGIIHGDLTTSNMIYSNKKIYLIDFGLSYFSTKTEDKAVDLHLLRQALESKHYQIFDIAFKLIIKGYKSKSNDFDEIYSRFEKVENRGRNKKK